MEWLIYLLGVLDDTKTLLLVFSIISMIATVFVIGIYAMERDSLIGGAKKILVVFLIELFICIISVLIPSSKTVAAIYLIPSIVENKQVQQIPEKTLKLFNLKLDAWIEETASNAIQNKK